MNNLYRELAPITDAAWAEIEEEAGRTFKRHVAGRTVVDFSGPHGTDFAAVGLGRTSEIDAPADGVRARQHRVASVVELRVSFTLSREELDNVERGAHDVDLDAVKELPRRSRSRRTARSSKATRPRGSRAFVRRRRTLHCTCPRIRATFRRPSAWHCRSCASPVWVARTRCC